MDVNGQLHFSPSSKTSVTPITLTTFLKLPSITKQVHFSAKPFSTHSINSQLNENLFRIKPFQHKKKPATIISHALINTKCCRILFQMFFSTRYKKHKKHGHPNKLHFQPFSKTKEKAITLTNNLKPTLFTKSAFSLETLPNTQKHRKHGHQERIALFTIFKNIGKTNHFTYIFKLTSIAKQVHFSAKPFARHSINCQLSENVWQLLEHDNFSYYFEVYAKERLGNIVSRTHGRTTKQTNMR